MTGRHRPANEEARAGLIEWASKHGDQIVLTLLNTAAAIGLGINHPGSSPSLAFLASVMDLRLWGGLFALTVALLLTGLLEAAHLCGIVGWVMYGYGAVAALATFTTPSPSGSVIVTGLTVGVAVRHVIGFGHAVNVRRARSGR